MNSMENASTLLGIIMYHAPDGKAQGLMAKRYYEITMQVMQDYESNQYFHLERTMASVLSDGLTHGNWPWSLPVSKVSDEEMLAHINSVFADLPAGTFVPMSEINVGRIYGGQMMAYVTSDQFRPVKEYTLDINKGVHGLTKNYISAVTKSCGDPECKVDHEADAQQVAPAPSWGPWGKEGRDGS